MIDIDRYVDTIRNYLDITYPDNAGDIKLAGIITRGMEYLNKVAGMELDYEKEGQARQLLFDYCRYVRANALEDFQTNFLSELLSLQNEAEIERYVKEQEPDV